MISFVRLEKTGELFARGHQMPTAIREALDEFLESEGVDPWEADEAAPRARCERTWYSARLGFTHDCAGHLESEAVDGCGEAEPVTVVRL